MRVHLRLHCDQAHWKFVWWTGSIIPAEVKAATSSTCIGVPLQ